MSEKVKPEKSDFQYEYNKLGVYIPAPTIRLSKNIYAAAVCGMSEIQMCCSVRFIAV